MLTPKPQGAKVGVCVTTVHGQLNWPLATGTVRCSIRYRYAMKRQASRSFTTDPTCSRPNPKEQRWAYVLSTGSHRQQRFHKIDSNTSFPFASHDGHLRFQAGFSLPCASVSLSARHGRIGDRSMIRSRICCTVLTCTHALLQYHI